MSTPPQVVQLTCPNCRTPIRAPIVTLIDVGSQPEMKSYLLSGQLNMIVCPNCSNVSMLAAPLIYHDNAKQLFLVYFPQQLNARPDEQERFIGEATSALMRALPADAPKGYLLSPKRFLTMNTLVETVLEADGISKEMIAAQRKRVDLIGQFAEAFEQGGEEQLRPLAEENRTELDYEFFATMTAYVQAELAADREESATMLLNLRNTLAALVGFEGLDGTTNEEADISLEDALERLTQAEDADLEQTIAELRDVIDYEFFELLTTQIEAAEAQGNADLAASLTARRAAIIETTERLDAQAQAMFEQSAALMQDAMTADDSAAVLRERREDINEAFLLLLESQQMAAERAGHPQIAERLGALRDTALQVLEEALSPEDRLINQLLQAEEAADATRLLRTNMAMITSAFVKRLNELAADAETQGRKPVGERLRQLAREAAAMLF